MRAAACPLIDSTVSLNVNITSVDGEHPDRIDQLPWLMPPSGGSGNDSWGILGGSYTIECVGGANGYVVRFGDGLANSAVLSYRCTPLFRAVGLGIDLLGDGSFYDIAVTAVLAPES
jgi:hypothetical protein